MPDLFLLGYTLSMELPAGNSMFKFFYNPKALFEFILYKNTDNATGSYVLESELVHVYHSSM